jgi:endonuclease/exonuclease/phosphatase family metal-dependent hydrolase
MPALKLDRVYLRELDPVRAETLVGDPWASLSDHAPVLVRAAWRKHA